MYEELQSEAIQLGLDVQERIMARTIRGLYGDGHIWINKLLPTTKVKSCTLAEEIGHHYTSAGNILDQSKMSNRKQELKARAWAYEKLIPLSQLLSVGQAGIEGRYAVAEWLNVTEEFLENAIAHYQRKYGLFTVHNEYLIYFEPLSVVRMKV